MARALLSLKLMMMVACVADEPTAAEACLDGWLGAGVPMTHVGLIMSESTQERAERSTRIGLVARDAVRVANMGIMAAGAIVEDLAGNRGGLVDALAGLGLARADAEIIQDTIQRGGVALVAFTEEDVTVSPTLASPVPSLVEEEDMDEIELEHVQFLNLDGVPHAGDPTARRFCLLEVD
jgi:hypothetical protein